MGKILEIVRTTKIELNRITEPVIVCSVFNVHEMNQTNHSQLYLSVYEDQLNEEDMYILYSFQDKKIFTFYQQSTAQQFFL